jgi:hypothetical protein
MSSTSASIQIPADPDRVWQLIGGFDSAPDWLPFILSSVVSDGGRVRTLTTKDGGVLLERLQAFDESRRTFTYSVDESPFPLTSYVSTLRVTEIPGRPDVALVEWSGAFQPGRRERGRGRFTVPRDLHTEGRPAGVRRLSHNTTEQQHHKDSNQ